MPLASRWADDPALVELAVEQDHKVVTSKKGRPLVSRWADADDGTEVEVITPAKKHTKEGTQHTKESASVKKSPRQSLSSRLGSLRIEQKSRDEVDDGHAGEGDDNHDDGDGNDDHNSYDDRIAPTKAAAEFAARLGISVKPVDKSQKNREKKVRAGTEWDEGKEPVSFKAEPKKGHIPSKKAPERVCVKKGPEPVSFKKERASRREPVITPKRESKRDMDKRGQREEHAEKTFSQEEYDKIFAREKQILEDLANGKKVDWADDFDF